MYMTIYILHHPDMERHIQQLGQGFVECSDRFRVILDRLRLRFTSDPNIRFVTTVPATKDQLLRVHTERYLRYLDQGTNGLKSLTANDPDMYYNEWTVTAAKLAAGAATELVELVCKTNSSGFAVVRPPGHHAGCSKAEGFCYINNVMVATMNALETGLAKRILVVDWDVHYHHGTSMIIYDKPDLTADMLTVFSMHRYDNGKFYPGKKRGSTGSYHRGMIVNHGFNRYAEDTHYQNVLGQFLDKYVRETGTPDLIVVSCGFDAAKGDPIGGFGVTPDGYYQMTKLLKSICPKVAMVLEGGYNLDVLPDCAEACIRALLTSSE